MPTTHETLLIVDIIEQHYDNIDAADRQSQLEHRSFHKKFSTLDGNKISGRPHHMGIWKGGAETNLGYRRT